MKKSRFIIWGLLAGGCLLQTQAQTPQFSIFDSFEQASGQGEGKVIIHQSEELKQLVGTRVDSKNIDVLNGKTYLVTHGFRVQIYSGNSRTSKEEAHARQAEAKKRHPDIGTYVIYVTPFWKLHVGDFRSFEEASALLRDMQAGFPSVKNEMYIVECDIRLLME